MQKVLMIFHASVNKKNAALIMKDLSINRFIFVSFPGRLLILFLIFSCGDSVSNSEHPQRDQSSRSGNWESMILDSDNDLFPDSAELHSESDRKAFLDWFVRIAESQFKKSNYGWNKNERDCSGLIRYAYREALKIHDREWYEKNGIVIDKNLPDVQRFHYPEVPVMGKNIFKKKEAPASDTGSFGVFADAENLMKFNTGFISRNLEDAKPGDILFFHDIVNLDSPYHSIIMVKNDLQETILLYHTGSEQGIKRVAVDYLSGSRKFSPEPWNKNFLGVFRFHIIQ